MKIIGNVKIFFLSMLFTAFIICYLVSFGLLEKFSIVVLTIFLCVFFKRIKKLNISAVCTGIIGMLLGMILCNYGLFFFEYKEECKKERINMDQNVNTAILLIFDGEPERYDLSILLKNMHRNSRKVDDLVTPLRIYGYKSAYEHVGISKYNHTSKRIGVKLSERLEGYYDVYISYLNNRPYYKEVFNGKIRKENYKKTIVVPVFLTESINCKYFINELQMGNLYTNRNMFKFMPPLWDSEKIVKGIVKDACNTDTKKKEVGIILMGRLKDIDKKRLDTKEINQECLFMEKIKEELIANGYEDRKIKFIGANPQAKEIKNMLGEIRQYGVTKILIIGVNDIVDKVQNQHKLEKLIRKLKATEEMDIIYMNGWGENDSIIEELEFRIRLMNVENWNE